MKTGYKQTEIGTMPDDWQVSTIEENAIIKTGGRNTQDRDDKGQYPFFVRSQTIEKIDSYSFDGEAVLTAGDGVGTGKIFHYINGRFDCHQRVYRISDFSNQLNGKFFYRVFSNAFYDRIMSMTAKSSVDSVRRDMIAEMRIPLPPLPEQKAIANALSDIDQLIASLDQLIAKKRDLKQAAMQQLLTGKTRLAGFSGEWETKRLGEVVAIVKGQLITQDTVVDGTIPVIAGGKKPAYFHNIANRFGKTITVSGSGASAGYVAKYDEPIFASDCCTISEGSTYDLDYIYYYLLSRQSHIYRSQTGGAQPHIHPKDLQPMIVGIPSHGEQVAIAATLSDMDAELTELAHRRDKTIALKQGMMQELLTGRTRLV